ncbi:hypothetical protein BDN72DRAFT_846421 [Pluteus cervinus]|uniref:Uncharacterized protein n=1 Tax=Pluteus cervinus TaxID=181527 RepID=A0ACD3AG86_9AGAR|nr:hypothetical protein BDN72DRAFT_846421 [Pluteus cervinus]
MSQDSGLQPLPTPAEGSTHFKLYKSPNPSWKFGQTIQGTAEGKKWMEGTKGADAWKVVDPKLEEPRKLYGLLLSGIGPRPIALVSSISAAGVENLAPFSWFNQVCSDPPTISVAVTAVAANKFKDTASNVKATRQFTVSIISEPWVEQANSCSVDAPPNISEWDVSGLTKVASTLVKPARVLESAFSMECELLQAVDIPHLPKEHVRKDMLNDRGVCDMSKLQVVGRIFGIAYSRLTEGYEMERPRWQDVEGKY